MVEDTRHLVEDTIRRIHSQGGSPVLAQHPDDTSTPNPPMGYLDFSEEDFSAPIHAIPAGARSGPDGVPAIMLKKTKMTTSRILSGIFKHSMEEGKIPGSVLGPLLFLIYIEDTSEGINSNILVYVDNSKST